MRVPSHYVRALGIAALLPLLAAMPRAAGAQAAHPAAGTGADSLRQAGHEAGIRAANGPRVAHSFIRGAAGGVLLAAGASLFAQQGEPALPALVAGSGVAVVITSLTTASSPLDSAALRRVAGLLADRPPAYADGFRTGYGARLRERRQNATVGGAVVGALVGALAMYALLSQWMDT